MIQVIVVDENDKEIGRKDRDLVTKDDLYRITGLWIENSKGEVLIAQRSFAKKDLPGRWGPAAAGTVENDETYEGNIIKEAEEEIGLKDFELITGPKFISTETDRRKMVQLFFAKVDKDIRDFSIQAEEVEQIKWVDKSWLRDDVIKNPDSYTPSIKKLVNM